MYYFRTHRSVAGGLIIFAIAYIIAEIGFKTPRNLISLGGMAVLVLFTFVCSHNPARVGVIQTNRERERERERERRDDSFQCKHLEVNTYMSEKQPNNFKSVNLRIVFWDMKWILQIDLGCSYRTNYIISMFEPVTSLRPVMVIQG